MRRQFVNYLLRFHGKSYSVRYKTISLFFGILFFMILLPAIFISFGFGVKNHIPFYCNRTFEIVLSILSIISGISFLIAAAIAQWKIGKGTPAPNAPTQQLIVSGVYKLCRNPIELGAILYYLGIGTVWGGIEVGLISFLSGLVIGNMYHKFVEEKELEQRFGESYKTYQRNTPFLFPRLIRRNNKNI